MIQKTQVLAHLKKNKDGISPLEALGVYKVYRLAAVILRLREAGWSIITEVKHDGVGGQYARYRLSTLQFAKQDKPLFPKGFCKQSLPLINTPTDADGVGYVAGAH